MRRLWRHAAAALQGLVVALLAAAPLLGPMPRPPGAIAMAPVPVARPEPQPAAEPVPAPVAVTARPPPAPVVATPSPTETTATERPAPQSAPEPKPADVPAGGDKAPPKPPASPLARELFGTVTTPAPLAARAIGFYSKGCLAGARALPIDGPTWQAMRLSRNRNWGHPVLIAWLQKFSAAAKDDGWPGLLVGDISQPRGGPMFSGHASHQVGLDADIWLTPMPDRRLSEQEREDMPAQSMLVEGDLAVDPKLFTSAHVALLKRAASSPQIERMFVHPAIKKALCEAAATDTDRTWLHKVRPTWGHYFHFHVRINCPKDSPDCKPQPTAGPDDGCGKELANWYKLLNRPKAPEPPPPPPGTPPVLSWGRPITLAQLPAACAPLVRSELAAKQAAAVPPATTAQPNSASEKK